MNSKSINRNLWVLTLPILLSPLADLLARNRRLTIAGRLSKSVMHSLFFVAIMLFASVEASALNSVTCSGGHVYLEQSHPDGDICWDTGLTCNGEWTYSWRLGKKGGDGGNVSASSQARIGGGNSGNTPQEIIKMLSSLKESDLTLFYQAPSSIVASFKLRKGWPATSKGTIEIPQGTLPTWFETLARKTSSGATEALNRAKSYPPHGYPCLGCHPCPPSYCDDNNKRMTASDLAPVLSQQGYRVIDGKITKAAGESQQVCSLAHKELLDRLAAVDACNKAEKEGRTKEAQNCRSALRSVRFPWAKTLPPTGASACPAIGPGTGAAGRIPCWSGVSGDGCEWAVCNVGHWWCWADCHGHGCAEVN
jgi:hypothetical protein